MQHKYYAGNGYEWDKKIYMSTKRLTYDYVKNYIESFGYSLVSDCYINNTEKVKLICPQKHGYYVNFKSFRNGCRCPVCFGTPKYTYEYVKNYVKSFGYILITKNYENNHQILKMRCPNGHICEIQFGNFKNIGNRCARCQGKEKHTIGYIKKYFEKYEYNVLSNDYKNAHALLNVKCSNGHVYKTSFSNFKRGCRCNKCRFSGAEKEVLSYVEKIYKGKIVENDRSQLINPYTKHWLELDIWMPEIKKAIEYNGYYHTLDEHSKRDDIKKELCKNMGIELLVIDHNEWKNNKTTIMNCISNFI